MTANSADGVVEAEEMRRFLLQCADNYGGHRRIHISNRNLSVAETSFINGAGSASVNGKSVVDEDGCDIGLDQGIAVGGNDGRRSRGGGWSKRLEEIRQREVELELEEMLTALDLDKDGKVSLDDFIRLLIIDQPNGRGGDAHEEEVHNNGKRNSSSSRDSGENKGCPVSRPTETGDVDGDNGDQRRRRQRRDRLCTVL